MPNYILYYSKEKKAYCVECKEEYDANILPTRKIGYAIECPKCKVKAILKNSKYTASQTEFGTAIIPCKENGELVFRYFNVSKYYKSGYKEYKTKYREIMRETFHENGSFSVVDKKYLSDTDFRKCKLPYGQYRISWYTHKPLGTHASISNKNCDIYTRNLSRYLKGTKAERVDIADIFNHIYFEDRYAAWSVMHDCYNGYAELYEYLIKVGLKNLAYQIASGARLYKYIDNEQKSLINMLRLSKENYKELLADKKSDITKLNLLQKYSEFGIVKIRDREVFAKYVSNQPHLMNKISDNKLTFVQLGKYADSQKEFDLQFYLDYLSICKKLELDMSNSFVKFPSDLKSAHNMVTDMYNEIMFTEKLSRYAQSANKYSSSYGKIIPFKEKKFSYENSDLQIVVPQNTKAIGEEGYKLRHCVAQYMQDIVADKKTILFIRDKKELDVPFFTMEIVGNEITQCKGYRNCPRPENVERFLNQFAKAKGLTITKDEYFAAIG